MGRKGAGRRNQKGARRTCETQRTACSSTAAPTRGEAAEREGGGGRVGDEETARTTCEPLRRNVTDRRGRLIQTPRQSRWAARRDMQIKREEGGLMARSLRGTVRACVFRSVVRLWVIVCPPKRKQACLTLTCLYRSWTDVKIIAPAGGHLSRVLGRAVLPRVPSSSVLDNDS